MGHHNSDRNRNRGGYNQQWDNDDNGNWRNSGSGNERNRYNDGYGRNRGDNRNSENERNSWGSDWMSNRAMYGSSTGINRGMMDAGDYGYQGRENSGWNRREDNEPVFGREDYNRSGRNRDQDRGWWDKTKDEVSSWFGDDDAERRRRMDESQAPHRGKGPKGYTRSDERIKEDVNDRLSDDPYVDASEIEVTVKNCEVTLTGTVNSRNEKRRAEDVVDSISGVKNVENRLRVNSMSSQNTNTMGSGTGMSSNAYRSTGANSGAYENSKS